jgi:hypothetical protein
MYKSTFGRYTSFCRDASRGKSLGSPRRRYSNNTMHLNGMDGREGIGFISLEKGTGNELL